MQTGRPTLSAEDGAPLLWLCENRAVPTGLGIFSHYTQHSAFGYVLGYDMPRLRRLIFAGQTPRPMTNLILTQTLKACSTRHQ